MSTMTPEYRGGKKFFPTESSLSGGHTPEFTKGGKQSFPTPTTHLITGPIAVTPESTKSGKQFPLEASLNT